MELFRVGGDVPDTNYLFMGMRLEALTLSVLESREKVATITLTLVSLPASLQAISSTVVSTRSSPSFCFCASRCATRIA